MRNENELENTKTQDFTDLRVWQSAHEIVLLTYRLTRTFPKDEKFTLIAQMRRAAISITSNIAEGFGRHASKDKEHFYVMASGSLLELKNQFIASTDLDYISKEQVQHFDELFLRCKSQLNALLKSHRANFKK